MVSKSVILKSIDDALSKSHQHLTIRDSNVISVMDDFHDKYCGDKPRKSEVAQFLSLTGEELFFKKGKKESVDFTDKEIRNAYEEGGEFHVNHNHPRGNIRPCAECLSVPDINFLKYNYRPYGKRPDGSEGYLVGEEGVYPIKSISCESSNGSRMTLVRGDKFSKADYDKLYDSSRMLEDYHEKYYRQYYGEVSKVRMNSNLNDFKDYDEYNKYLHDTAIKEVGVFEQNPKFKEIQRSFRDANCKLMYTFPYEYTVGNWQ